jgi:NAD-dependent dihydropyrimidine dehydrogenase PreA subunit
MIVYIQILYCVFEMKFIADRCGFCGACVAVCPQRLLEVGEKSPKIQGDCKNCGNCTIVCPLGAIKLEDSNEI